MHDHPYAFVSFVLKGEYVEEREAARPLVWAAPSCHYMGATWLHRVIEVRKVPTWTLLLVGRRRRNWGFQAEHGWVAHQDYLNTEES